MKKKVKEGDLIESKETGDIIYVEGEINSKDNYFPVHQPQMSYYLHRRDLKNYNYITNIYN